MRTVSLEMCRVAAPRCWKLVSPGAAGVPDSKACALGQDAAPALQLLAFYPRHLAQTLAHE